MIAPCAYIAIEQRALILARAPLAREKWLSESESERLATLRHEGRRTQYLAGHWLVRELVSAALGGGPHDWKLQERRSQSPCLIDAAPMTWLSISHSGEWIAAAVASLEVGIDIEQKPRLLDPSVELLLLSPGKLAGTLSNDELLRRWVAKEAWLKCQGASASPDHLKEISLCDTPVNRAQLRTVSDSRLCLALAIGSHAEVIWQGQPLRWDMNGFCVHVTR